MFDELWIIKESQCLYYKCQTRYPINLDVTLFAGFFSAFHAFQEEIDENFFVIVRESIHKPLNRSILQLNNLAIEILTSIENHYELHSLLFDKKNRVFSLNELTPMLSPLMDQTMLNLSVSDDQMNTLILWLLSFYYVIYETFY